MISKFKINKTRSLVKESYNLNKTEKEIMVERQYYYFDSGNMKFILNL